MKNMLFRAVAVAAASCLVAHSVMAASDVVDFRAGEGKRAQLIGNILTETWEGVKIEFQLKGETKVAEVTTDRIIRVSHGEKPPGYAKASGLLDGGDYAGAREQFEKFLKAYQAEPEKEPWVKPYTLFGAAEAAFNEARYVTAAKENRQERYRLAEEYYSRLVQEYPNHRFVPDAKLRRAICLMRLDRFEEAESELASIEDTKYPEAVKLKAELWGARLLAEQNKPDEAIEKIKKVRDRIPDKYAELRYHAMMAEAYALQAKGEFRQAERLFLTVALMCDDEELEAEACISRGLSLKKRGNLREALYSLLRVIVLHFRVPHEYQRALYHAALVAKEYYPDGQRAKELANELYNKFPDSYWANKLKADMAM